MIFGSKFAEASRKSHTMPAVTISALAHAPAGCQWRVETPTGVSFYATRTDAEAYAKEYRDFYRASSLAN